MNRSTVFTLFENYPDAMSLKQFAECLGISSKLAARILREDKIHYAMAGSEYRVAKTSVIDFLTGANQPAHKKNCVETVTSNPEGWTCQDKCGIVCDTKSEKEISL